MRLALPTLLERLVAGRSLSSAECDAAVASMLDGEATDTTMAAFLTALRIKGETADELAGAVSAVRARMTRWEHGIAAGTLLDTCGTGGDCADTVNISTAAAIVVAACGVPVAKHGNRAASSPSGSSDVLSALGVAIDPEMPVLDRCLSELNIAFLFAPRFHHGLSRVAAVRRQLPFRTLFNLVGPLCNPACPSHQLIGVPNAVHADLLAKVLSRQGHIRRAVVVSGAGGLDEVTLDGSTRVWVVARGLVECELWQPEDFGMSRQSARALQVSGPVESASRLKHAFEGERGPVRDFVLANSAAALWVTGRCSLREGTTLAASAIDSGEAARLLERWALLAPAADSPSSSDERAGQTLTAPS
jgi:anthranilate phosphoribosyltransferase